MDLLTELRQRLADWGVHCVLAMPNLKLPRLTQSGVFLGILESVMTPRFAGNLLYLDGIHNPSHAVQAETTVFFDIYTPYRLGAPACQQMRAKVRNALLTAFTYYTVQNLTCGSCYYDPKSDYFRCRITLKIQTWMSLDEKDGGLT